MKMILITDWAKKHKVSVYAAINWAKRGKLGKVKLKPTGLRWFVPDDAKPFRKPLVICRCGKTARARGLCTRHYAVALRKKTA
jgi:hypothetical protein